MLLHAAGSCIGIAGTIGGVWWLNKNPALLPQGIITGLAVVLVLFLALFIMIGSISHSHLERDYGFDPQKNLIFE
jgi:Na+/proline symporter